MYSVEVWGYMHPLVYTVHSCLLIRYQVGQSKYYQLWNYISHWDYKHKLTEVTGSSVRRTTTVKKKKKRKLYFFDLIHLYRPCSVKYIVASDHSGFALLCQESWIKEDEWNPTEGQGKIKIQKYIFMFIFIYIYIFTRYVSTKRKHPNFQNRQSVFFQICPYLWHLKETIN